MDINTAEYIGSWQKNADMPHTELPEFAFIGRSNVGKSSLINMLTQRNGLAKTSSTPGKTQSINLFLLNKKIQFVDLPGYGFATGAKKDSSEFNKAVGNYLRKRPNLSLVFVLVDSGLEPQEIDLEFLEWLTSHGVPFVLVAATSQSDQMISGRRPTSCATLLRDWTRTCCGRSSEC